MAVPTPEQFFTADRSKPDIAFLKNHFYREGRLSEEQALWILDKGTELLRREPNVLNVDAPITGETDRSCFTDQADLVSVLLFSVRRHSWAICAFSYIKELVL